MNNLSSVSDIEKHSAAHVLAMAVARVYPLLKIGVGPVTKSGFYYDFDISGEISKKNLQRIEDEVKKIIKEDLPFQQIIVRRAEAMNLMLQRGQIYKTELINSIPDEELSFFKTGEEFIDLCRGPHVNTTGELGPIKITSVEDVYWNNNPSRPKLKRISGMLFKNEDEVGNFEKLENEKVARDFHKYAPEKGYGFHNEGVFYPSEKGYRFINNLYKKISTGLEIDNIKQYSANVNSGELQQISKIIDKALFLKQPSHKNLPITILSKFIANDIPLKDKKTQGEVIFIKRYTRQSDAIFGINILDKFTKFFEDSNIEFYTDLKYHNLEDGMFNLVSGTLQRNLISHNKIQTEYKEFIEIELKTNDDLGREWTFAKININTDNFNQTMVLSNKESKLAYLEFIVYPLNILVFFLENYKENFPTHLNPTQFIIIPVNKKFESQAEEVQRRIRKFGLESEVSYGNMSFKAKIRKYENKNIPILLIVGQKEVENESVSVRINNRDEGLITIDNLNSYIEANFLNK